MTEPSEKTPAKPTRYAVLREGRPAEDGGDVPYYHVGFFHGVSAAAARQSAFAKLPTAAQQAGAVLVAVPARSWQLKHRKLVSTPRSVES